MLRRVIPAVMESQTQRVPIPRRGVDYRGKVVLAPMVRSGELPSRLLALKYGADLVWGPETIDRAMIGAKIRHNPRTSCIEFTRQPSHGKKIPDADGDEVVESIIYRIHPELESSRLIYQIGTASPDYAVEAATMVAPYVAGIDVNAGCPKPFSTSGGMGAALLSTPDLLCDILHRLVQDVGNKFEIGISVKIRLLPNEGDTRVLVERLCKTGITGLTIHCRTRAMRKTEQARREQLRMIGETCRAAGVACLVNGDVEDREHGEALAAEFGVDGAMIAEAAESNLTVFRPKEEGGKAPWPEVIEGYLNAALDVENRWGNTKFLLAQLMPGKEQAKRSLGQTKNYQHVVQALEMDHLLEKARKVDEIIGSVNHECRSDRKKRKGENNNTTLKPNKSVNNAAKKQYVHNSASRDGGFIVESHKEVVQSAVTV